MKKSIRLAYYNQELEVQLSQRGRAMPGVIEYFAKSLKITRPPSATVLSA